MSSLEDRIRQEEQLEREAAGIIYDTVTEPMDYIFPPAPLHYIYPPAPLHYVLPPSPPTCLRCAGVMADDPGICAKCDAEERRAKAQATRDTRHQERINRNRTCVGCLQRLPADSFLLTETKGRRPYRASRCHECRSEYARWRNYGITKDQYEAVLALQGGVCAICAGGPESSKGGRLHVDHDHATGEVRGLLCAQCNHGLGQFQDSTQQLEAAIAYLKTAGRGTLIASVLANSNSESRASKRARKSNHAGRFEGIAS